MRPCQPGGSASCAGCCGLYSGKVDSASLALRLRRRSDLLRAAPKTREAFHEVARALRAEERPLPGRPAAGLRGASDLCVLAGFIEPDGRIGCLGHPMVTGGPDLRDCGTYGALSCESFMCPAVGAITDEEISIVREACADWFLYGLVVTDVGFVRSCLSAVATCGRRLTPDDLLHERVLASLRALFALKQLASVPFGEGAGATPSEVLRLAAAVAVAAREAGASSKKGG